MLASSSRLLLTALALSAATARVAASSISYDDLRSREIDMLEAYDLAARGTFDDAFEFDSRDPEPDYPTYDSHRRRSPLSDEDESDLLARAVPDIHSRSIDTHGYQHHWHTAARHGEDYPRRRPYRGNFEKRQALQEAKRLVARHWEREAALAAREAAEADYERSIDDGEEIEEVAARDSFADELEERDFDIEEVLEEARELAEEEEELAARGLYDDVEELAERDEEDLEEIRGLADEEELAARGFYDDAEELAEREVEDFIEEARGLADEEEEYAIREIDEEELYGREEAEELDARAFEGEELEERDVVEETPKARSVEEPNVEARASEATVEVLAAREPAIEENGILKARDTSSEGVEARSAPQTEAEILERSKSEALVARSDAEENIVVAREPEAADSLGAREVVNDAKVEARSPGENAVVERAEAAESLEARGVDEQNVFPNLTAFRSSPFVNLSQLKP